MNNTSLFSFTERLTMDFLNYTVTDFNQRIYDGYYNQEFSVGPKPTKSQLLLKRAGDLNQEEINRIPQAMQEFDQAVKLFEERKEQARIKSNALYQEFWDDLCSHNCVSETVPFVQKMIEIVKNHAEGHEEVASMFSDLMGLYEIYSRK